MLLSRNTLLTCGACFCLAAVAHAAEPVTLERGFGSCRSKAIFERLLTFVEDKDGEAFKTLLGPHFKSGNCSYRHLEKGQLVYIEEIGPRSSCVRPRGKTHCLYVSTARLLNTLARSTGTQSNFEPFDFPTPDTSGTYTMLEMKRIGQNLVVTLVRRGGRSGNLAFTRRLIDCRSMQFQTLGSAFSMEGLKEATADPKWHTPFPGWTDEATVAAACVEKLSTL